MQRSVNKHKKNTEQMPNIQEGSEKDLTKN